MTDFQRIRSYYDRYDEWSRLDAPEGRLEYEILMNIILREVVRGSTILDLGGGPGRYTAALSSAGYEMHLADLSPELIAQARHSCAKNGDAALIKSMEVVNALDLHIYDDEKFDAVLLLGPLYHLTRDEEIVQCLTEVNRVLKRDGILIAVYIPWLSGVKSVLARALYRTAQANSDTLLEVLQTGRFHNKSGDGFQDGYFIKTDRLETHMQNAGFQKKSIRSLRGVGNGMEKGILESKDTNPILYRQILDLITATATEPSVIDSCGHAVYTGIKP